MTSLNIDDINRLLGKPTSNLEKEVNERVRLDLALLEEAGYGIAYPEIDYSLKGTTAGYAYRQKNLIKLNLDMLLHENYGRDMLFVTLPHELAHLAAFKYYPSERAHGSGWQYIMARVFHLQPNRCHSYDTKEFKQRSIARPYKYNCPTCGREFYLTNNLHAKVKMGRRRICKLCKSTIMYVGAA